MWNSSVYVCVCAYILQNFIYFSDGYRHIRPQDYLCADKLLIKLQKPFRGPPTLTLTEDRESAAIIRQVWNSTQPGSHGNKNLKYDCEFRVQTPEKPPRGIYTVITKLNFRQDQATGGCIDYVQFSSGNRSPSNRICNTVSVDGYSKFLFDQRDRFVMVHIHIGNRTILEPLELTMVLTSHSECKYTGDFPCDRNDSHSCISRHFVRDNITNCMYPCKDEITCFNDVVTAEEMNTTNVAISAITSLIFTMLGVGFCVWICWKYWNCITVQQHAREESAAHRRANQMDAPTIDLPTSPLDDVITTTHELQPQTPKDLPPSYESLFPDR